MSLFENSVWANYGLAPRSITWATSLYYSTTTYNQIVCLLNNISSVVNISYAFGGSGGSTYLEINGGYRSYAYYSNFGSDVYLSVAHYGTATGFGFSNGIAGTYSGNWLKPHARGFFAYVDLLHELGHTLGLKHVHVGDSSSTETPDLLNLRGIFTYFLGDGSSSYNGDYLNKA